MRRRRSRFWVGLLGTTAVILLAVFVAGRAADTGTTSPNASPPISPRPLAATGGQRNDPLFHESGVALGVNVAGPPEVSLQQYARMVGEPPRVAMWYQNWDEPLYYHSEAAAAASVGALLLISWEPIQHGAGVPLGAIAAGDYDSYIRSAALAAIAYKRPLYVRFAPEMNLRGAAFGPGHDGNTPALFIAAWRHVVGIFRAAGASNVVWIWSPNIYCNGHCPFTAYYPGDAWVDWVALDGYNSGPVDGDPWESFVQLFSVSYRTLTALTSKPVMIGETASTELGGDKAQWITDIGPALAHNFPRVRALIWFQRIKEADWRVNSSPASLQAFRRLAASPQFR